MKAYGRKGRPKKYFSNIRPYLDKIPEMALNMTERQIAEELGVGYTAFNEYKKLYPELNEALKKGRKALVIELRGTLLKKAKGFQYSEKKILKENGEIVREEIYEKTSLPDVAAINLLLKNYDKENWANDPQELELKKKELKLKEKHLEKNDW